MGKKEKVLSDFEKKKRENSTTDVETFKTDPKEMPELRMKGISKKKPVRGKKLTPASSIFIGLKRVGKTKYAPKVDRFSEWKKKKKKPHHPLSH